MSGEAELPCDHATLVPVVFSFIGMLVVRMCTVVMFVVLHII